MEAKEKNGKIYLVCDDCDIEKTDLIVYRVHNQVPRILCQRCYAKRMVNWSQYDLVSNSKLDKLEYAKKYTVNGKLRYTLTKRYRKTQGGAIYYQNTYYEDNVVVASETFVDTKVAEKNRNDWGLGRISVETIKAKPKRRAKRKAPYRKRKADEYLKSHYKTYCIALNYESDKEMIEWLMKQPNQTQAFRELYQLKKTSDN